VLPLGAGWRCPEPGSRLAVGHPGGVCLDGGEDIVRLGPCGCTAVVTVGVWSRVSVSFNDASSRLICAGWLPQDRVFGWSVTAGLRTSVAEDP
jgi:hypothetical protein